MHFRGAALVILIQDSIIVALVLPDRAKQPQSMDIALLEGLPLSGQASSQLQTSSGMASW